MLVILTAVQCGAVCRSEAKNLVTEAKNLVTEANNLAGTLQIG